MQNAFIVELFDGVTDFRRTHLRRYHLTDVLFLCICASLCGADAYTQIASFGEERHEWLKKFGAFATGIPSHDTIQRILELLSPKELGPLLTRWSQTLSELRPSEALAIDGKALRGTWKKSGKPGITLVSLWASEQRLCLGVEAVGPTGGEGAAAAVLLELIALKGKIITADAGFLSPSFCEQVLAQKADYIVTLKANQPTLLADAVACFEETTADCSAKSVVYQSNTLEKNKGRVERRECLATCCKSAFLSEKAAAWPGLRTFIRINTHRAVRKAGGWTEEKQTRYYISSLLPESPVIQGIIRGHWGIENQQHYVLDVTMNEDGSTIRSGHGAQNMALCRRIALNLARTNKPDKLSLKGAFFKAALSLDRLEDLLMGSKSDA